MRDFILVVFIIGAAPVCLANPYFGVMMWYWVSYFNPHRFTWSYAYNFPVALFVAVPTLVGTIFAPKSMRSLLARESLFLAAIWGWFSFTYVNAQKTPFFQGHMSDAAYEMSHISKILLMTFVMLLVINTREKLRGVMLITGASLGLLAVKGTIFGLRTTGESRVWGPPDSFLADNNALGLALNMCLPLLFFLAREEKNKYIRLGLRICFFCSILSVILTYSRGGLLGLAVVLLAITLKSKHKVAGMALLVTVAFLVLLFSSGEWMDRMSRFMKGDLDSSANQRLVAWETAWRFAQDYPVTGGGFDTLPDENVFQRYKLRDLPEGFPSTASHSIYFQLLSDQGFVGLGLFLMMIASCLWSLWRIRRMCRMLPSANWLVDYTHMVEISILAFMVSGAFLGFVYLDVIYQMVATVVVIKIVFRQAVSEHVAQLEENVSPVLVSNEVSVPA